MPRIEDKEEYLDYVLSKDEPPSYRRMINYLLDGDDKNFLISNVITMAKYFYITEGEAMNIISDYAERHKGY